MPPSDPGSQDDEADAVASASAAAGTAAAAQPPEPAPAGGVRRGTRQLIATLFQHPSVVALPLVVAKHAKVVELMVHHLQLPLPREHDGRTLAPAAIQSYERCWTAVDSFLIGRPIDEIPLRFRFSRGLRTVNFCVDLYEDHQCRPEALPVDRYLRTRQALLHGTTVAVGRFQLPLNEFRDRQIDLQQPHGGDILRSVPAICTRNDPPRVFAMRNTNEIRTLFGRVVFAEEVVQPDRHLQPVFVTTRRRVVLKYFDKARLVTETRKCREDPFKEIASLQWLQEKDVAPGMFPYVLDVLDNDTGEVFVKVEQDCGTVLIDTVTKPSSLAVRIPENWVVHILSQLVQGVYVPTGAQHGTLPSCCVVCLETAKHHPQQATTVVIHHPHTHEWFSQMCVSARCACTGPRVD